MFELPKLLVTGADGQLGYELAAQAQEQGFDVVSCSALELDVCDQQAVTALLSLENPRYVVNAVEVSPLDGSANVDYQANAVGPRVLAKACSELGIALIQLSSAEIFDGLSDSPYREFDKVSPCSDYAHSLWQGEQAVRSNLDRYLILRTGWLFSARAPSSVLKLLESARKNQQVCVADGLKGAPTSAVDLSRVVMAVIKQLDCGAENWGTYHYCATETVSWFGFSEAIVAAARQYEDLQLEALVPVHQSELGVIQRIEYSELDCSSILCDFGIHQRSWRTGLMMAMRNLYSWSE